MALCRVAASTDRVDRRVHCSSGSCAAQERSIFWPMAVMTASQAIANSEPSTITGRRRPPASGCPSSVRMHSRPQTLPPSAIMRTGAVRKENSMASSRASLISSGYAGISFSLRRYTTRTVCAPRRTATLAASTATLPPPTITTCLPGRLSPPRFTCLKNSTASITPRVSASPATLSFTDPWAPIPRKTAAYPSDLRSASVKSVPRRIPVRTSIPRRKMPSISRSNIFGGSR